MIALLLGAATALAATPPDEVERMFTEVVAAFEEEARISFSDVPPLLVSTIDEVVLDYIRPLLATAASREQIYLLAEEHRAMLENFPAYYDLETEKIYILEDVLAELREDAGLGPEADWLPCILAHELTHALQHQMGWVTRHSTKRWMIEGHANHLGARVCAAMGLPEGLALMNEMHGLVPALAPRTLSELPVAHREEVIGYSYSWALLDQVYAREGDAGVEALLLDPLPPAEIVSRVVAPHPLLYWSERDLQVACEMLGRSAGEVTASNPTIQGLWAFSDVIVTGQGCEAVYSERSRGYVRALLLADTDAAAALMAAYRDTPGTGGFFYFAGAVEIPGADEAFILEQSASAAVFARVGERVVIAEQHGGRLDGRRATAMLAGWLPALPAAP